MSSLKVGDLESHRIETTIPEDIIKAVQLVMASAHEGYQLGSSPNEQMTTELRITSKAGVLTLFGMIKEMSCDYSANGDPFGYESPIGRPMLGSRSYGSSFMSNRIQADAKFGMFTQNASWNEALSADEVLKIKAMLWEILSPYLTASYETGVLERLIDEAFGKVLSDSRNTKSQNSTNKSKIKEKKKEEVQMFGKHKITEVVISEINPITLELAMKKLAASNSKIEILERKDVVYLVAEGSDPVELNGEQFKTMIEKALIGKTILEVKANASISQLLGSLNVVESITLTKQQVSLTELLK